MDLIARIDAARARWNVLDHPFYTRWSAGELTAEELALYSGQYRHAVVALAGAAAATGDPEHAAEERDHIALWDGFLTAAGGDTAAEPLEGTLVCASAWSSPRDELEARAVLYAIEASQPAISKTKLEGLVERYGFAAGPATEYFELHGDRDHEHAGQSRAVLEAAPAEEADRLVAAAERALRGNWELLDSVERACMN